MSHAAAMLAGALVTVGAYQTPSNPYFGWCFVAAIVACVVGAISESAQ